MNRRAKPRAKSLKDYPEASRLLALKNRAAFNALATSTGTEGNIATLYAAVVMARKLAGMFGHGAAYSLEIDLATAAVKQLWARKAAKFGDLEETCMAVFLDVHEAQLEIVLVEELDAAIAEIKEEEST